MPTSTSSISSLNFTHFVFLFFFFFSSRRRHTRLQGDWSSDVCSSDLASDVRVRAVVIIVIELQRGFRACVSGPVLAVDEDDVGPAVVVVVDEGAARDRKSVV